MAKTTRSQAFQKHLPHSLKVNVYNRQKALPIQKRLVRSAVSDLLTFLQLACNEISVYFVSEKEITNLHSQFFDDPTPTDCVTFPLDDPETQGHIGEVFISPSAAILYTAQKNLDPHEETLLYLIHGILHLAGYDDLEPEKRRVMRKMEKKCMRHLRTRGISLAPVVL